MAEVVAAFCASHAPMMLAARESAPQEQRERFFAGLDAATRGVREVGAEATVIVSNEHFTNFFLENFPQTCVGLSERHLGPAERWLPIERGYLPGHADLAMTLTRGLLDQGFEPAFSHDLRLDHGIMTIYHALSPERSMPLVPIVQNCAVHPMMPLRRCFELGRALRRAIEDCETVDRVAVVGAGGLSHWIGTERVGDIDERFDRWFLARLAGGSFDEILDMPDEELEVAGNGAHEIRSWLTVAAAAGVPARVLAYEPIREWITGMGVVDYDLADAAA